MVSLFEGFNYANIPLSQIVMIAKNHEFDDKTSIRCPNIVICEYDKCCTQVSNRKV